MLLGKRPRPPIMKRTTSMSGGMAVDMQVSNLEAREEVLQSDDPLHQLQDGIKDPHAVAMKSFEAKEYDCDERLVGMVMSTTTATGNHRQNQTSNSAHPMHTALFLRTCGLCNCHLAPGRDIYMYRGDTAFCSLECREQQMKRDEKKGKWKVASDKEDHRASQPTANSKASNKSETIAAV